MHISDWIQRMTKGKNSRSSDPDLNIENDNITKKDGKDFPGSPEMKISPFNVGVWILTLVGELRSQMLWG